MTRTCYLFGANPSIMEASRDFAEKAGGEAAHIALLILRREGWEEYLPRYTKIWKDIGVKNISIILPDEKGNLDQQSTLAILDKATGIFIGSGDSEKYYHYYGTGEIRSKIRDRYFSGVPVAGCSAGALLIPETCILSPNDTKEGKPKVHEGLGLLKNLAVSVHFSEWNDRPYIEKAMRELSISKGYGIDEEACVLFENETFSQSFGKDIHLLQVRNKFSKSNENILANTHIYEMKSKPSKQTICERQLRMLTEWFGIESAIDNYLGRVTEFPMIVAEVDGEIVGFLSIEEQTKDADEIYLTAINPRFHRCGIGKMLIDEMEERANINKKSFLTVKTLSENHPDPHYRNTRKFYEAVGFTGVQELPELWGKENPCLIMVKKL